SHGQPFEPPASVLACMDRFELEDHFLPHRRPEPEVQLAIDRGLELLADALVAPAPRGALEPESSVEEEASAEPERAAHVDDPAPAAPLESAPELPFPSSAE